MDRSTQQRLEKNDASMTTEETRTSQYDLNGNLLSRSDLHGTSSFSYDALNRSISESRGGNDSYTIGSSLMHSTIFVHGLNLVRPHHHQLCSLATSTV